MIDISKFSRAKVLAEPLGLGILRYDPKPMTEEEAETLLSECTVGGFARFDYIRGRSIKVDFTTENELSYYLYDREYGDGAAQKVINSIIPT